VARGYHYFSDSGDESVRTVDFCTDSGLTVNNTLTMTLTDGNESAWLGPSEPFNEAGFGLHF
jgi:hypothetical protein